MRLRSTITLCTVAFSAAVTISPAAFANDVLVWKDAKLYVEPSLQADHVAIGSLAGTRERSLGAVLEIDSPVRTRASRCPRGVRAEEPAR
jgi:hypothetical protein